MAGGRPTKLTKALISKAAVYMNGDWEQNRRVIPTVEALALYLDVSRSTIYEWAEGDTPLQHEFSDILERILAFQGDTLLNGALKGNFNSTIAKMILSGKHGYVEKSQQDLTTNGKDLPTPILGGVSVTNKGGENVPGHNT